jgi:chromosome segregation ATPase
MDPISDKKSSSYWSRGMSPGVRAVLGRWWWLAMPLVGLVCAEAYVSPHVADSQDAVNRIKKMEQDKLEELEALHLTESNRLYAVEMTIDTLYLPEVQWSTRTRDSLRTVRGEIESRFPLLETQIANLTQQIGALQDPIQEAKLAQAQKEKEIEGYKASIEALRDSLSGLMNEHEALGDRLYRLQHPEEFDRSRGLIDPRREEE